MNQPQIEYPVIYNEEIANRCVYGASFVRDLLGISGYKDFYKKDIVYPMSSRKIEGFLKLAENKKYYQENPVKFIKDFFNIQLVDSQAYLMQMAWTTPQVMICASRAYGKSFWIVLFAMAKQMLSTFPWNCYIASGNSQQSATTFKKLEDIANDRISSLINSSGYIFKDEVIVGNAAGDGFSHNPSGFTYALNNDSFTKTLSSNVDGSRGARASCVIFDESAFLSQDLLSVYKAFCATDNQFATGFDNDGNSIDQVRLLAMPKPLPNQLIYVSSASSTDTPFYTMYRDFSKQMFLGNKDYFVAQIDCNLVMKPTIMNVPTSPALTKEAIESDMRNNPEKARREYYCEFTTEAGADAIIRRGVIARNEETRKPLLYNDTGDKKFVIAYDPARSRDNSIILVGEIFDAPLVNGDTEKQMRLVNCINLMDVGKKIKSPMQTPDQVKYLKQVILDYNAGADAYGNIIGVYIDAGSGGAGVNIADYLMEDWTDKAGIVHRGLIDKEYSAEYVKKFPNAVDKVHLMAPAAYKSEMYESLIEAANQNKIKFTSSYDGKGYLTVFDLDEKKLAEDKIRIENKLKKQKLSEDQFAKKLEEELKKAQSMSTKLIQLDWQDELALNNIDATKEEAVNMVRKRRDSGKDSFELTPEKANTMHDDRAYCLAMAGYALMQERRKNITKRRNTTATEELVKQLTIRRGYRSGSF